MRVTNFITLFASLAAILPAAFAMPTPDGNGVQCGGFGGPCIPHGTRNLPTPAQPERREPQVTVNCGCLGCGCKPDGKRDVEIPVQRREPQNGGCGGLGSGCKRDEQREEFERREPEVVEVEVQRRDGNTNNCGGLGNQCTH